MNLCEAIRSTSLSIEENFVEIIQASVDAADPYYAVKRFLQVDDTSIRVGERKYKISDVGKVVVTAFGKAAIPMTIAARDVLLDLVTSGVVLTKHLPETNVLDEKYRIYQGGHPIPTMESLTGTQAVLSSTDGLQENDLVLCLVSGGASALFTRPRDGVSLNDMQVLVGLLLESGASIEEINTIRKHLDQVKGGGFARLVQPAKVAALILSDVVGSPMDIIASGPTVPDTSTFFETWEILERYRLTDRIPNSVIEIIQQGKLGQIPETPKSDDRCFNNVQNMIIADNRQSALAALRTAHQKGFNAMFLSSFFQGEAKIVGQNMAGILKEVSISGNPVRRPACIVAGGETTVTISGNGFGGRNLETALGAVRDLAGLENVIFLSLATDGEDGPTDAAGALVTGETFDISQKLGLNIEHFLAQNDSYHFFEQAGGLICCGPSGTNVNDLFFLFAY